MDTDTPKKPEPQRGIASTPTNDDATLQQAQEKLLRRRAELGIKNQPKSICTSERGYRVSEVLEVKEASEASKESPCGDFSPSAAFKTEIQNAEESESDKTLLTASVESELYARGGETEAEQLFHAVRYDEISAGEFLELAWGVSAGKDWQEDGCSETWEFCRYLLAHSEFKNLRGAPLSRKLRRLTDLDEGLLDVILSEIERVKFAHGLGPLEWAVKMSCQYPLSDPEDLQIERYNKFLSIAGWLQVSQHDKPIVLPVAKLASELGVTPQIVSNWRQRAQRQGLLKEVARYVAHKQATRFRFAVERFSILRERGNL
jgi:hypothetical protein